MITDDDLLALPGAEAADLYVLRAIEEGAVAFVGTQTRRYFGPTEEVTTVVAGRGIRNLWLPDVAVDNLLDAYDGEAVVTVVSREYPGADPSDVVDFEVRVIDNEAVLVRTGSAVVWTRDYEYTVTYYRGYEEGEEPSDIRQLVLDLVASRWGMRGSEGLKSENIGGYNYTRFDESDLESVVGGWSTIKAYRKPVFA